MHALTSVCAADPLVLSFLRCLAVCLHSPLFSCVASSVGASGDADNAGSVSVYALIGGTSGYYQRMGSKQVLWSNDSAADFQLGAAVAMDATGTQIAIGGRRAHTHIRCLAT